ncbi:hypothetical protein [Terracoccus sp. 273MFTsu3.1]|uniref:hypothetical protein n=1 Tax=Terracoccus sp. 273MFTsu3.1 TaxID=1172188 RepID=UPI0003A86283|nr:hypothetical protein [Terracoccus sp. 273MFTsu3.1]
MRRFVLLATLSMIAGLLGLPVTYASAATVTPPPAPALVGPAAGASVVEPFTLQWGAVVDPDGPIGSYTWQVGTSSTFSTVIASGFTQESLAGIPVPTTDTVSGLPLGSYFWRVQASQTVGGTVGSIDSAWSPVRSFTVTGLGAAPGTPSFTSPATGARFHASEFFDISWTAVPGAHYYLLEADDEPTFSYPLSLTTDLVQFGTTFRAGWGNEIPNVYYRIRAVSAAGVHGLPSPTLNVKITNTAPTPPAPTLLSPTGGTSRSIPLTFDWSDTPNRESPAYDLDIDDDPAFAGSFGVFLIQNLARSDYLLVDTLAPGTYFWRVRAVHGQVRGPWSATGTFTVVAGPAVPQGLGVLSLVATPSSVFGGNATQARVTLTQPAPVGGVTVKVASDMAGVETPASVFIPAGATDAMVTPITTSPVGGASVGSIRAAYGTTWQQSSLGSFPLLWGHSLGAETVVGGHATTGTVTLLNPAPAGGAVVTLVSADPAIVALPPTVFIPAGGTGASFTIDTTTVSAPTRVKIDSGYGAESYRSPSLWLTVAPPGTVPPAALASLALTSASIAGGATTTGTVTLTGPAPTGGATIRLSGSMEGQVVTPPSVTVPAGSTSATFTITAPSVPATYYVLIQAGLGFTAGTQARLLEIRPGSTAPTLAGFSVSPTDIVSGTSTQGIVELVTSAPAGGGTVTLTSSNPAVLQVPATVSVPAGNNSTSFAITTTATSAFTTVQVDASAGGVTRSAFINLAAGPTAPSLVSLSIAPASVTGGSNATGTVALSSAAPSAGSSVTLATGNSSAAQVPPTVSVPAGQTQASFPVTTSSVAASTPVTITAFSGSTTRTATVTVTPTSVPPSGMSVGLSGVPATVRRGQSFTATATVTNGGTSTATGSTVVVSFTPTNALRLTNPTSSTQPTGTVAGGGTKSVAWQMRADNAATATVTMTLRSSAGVTLGTATRTVKISN